mmetsp:Transcript_3667/g.8749  ORF Transcript_3667/g.8749 Transcript_3667/m.8749 type:complete len:205 (-) Transcript_3667:8-622(-)
MQLGGVKHGCYKLERSLQLVGADALERQECTRGRVVLETAGGGGLECLVARRILCMCVKHFHHPIQHKAGAVLVHLLDEIQNHLVHLCPDRTDMHEGCVQDDREALLRQVQQQEKGHSLRHNGCVGTLPEEIVNDLILVQPLAQSLPLTLLELLVVLDGLLQKTERIAPLLPHGALCSLQGNISQRRFEPLLQLLPRIALEHGQ